MATNERRENYKNQFEIEKRLKEVADLLDTSGLIYQLNLSVKELEEDEDYAHDVGGVEHYSHDAWDHSWC